jgi:hypothetical protein
MELYRFTVTVELDFPEELDEQDRYDLVAEIEDRAGWTLGSAPIGEFRQAIQNLAREYDCDITVTHESGKEV